MRLGTAEYAYPVDLMCAKLGASRSGYYDWRSRPESATSARRKELKVLIAKIFEESDSTYGYRRVHAQLLRWDVQAGRELVRQVMRELGLVPASRSRSASASPKPGSRFRCPILSAGTSLLPVPGRKWSAT
jgi:putative transposase